MEQQQALNGFHLHYALHEQPLISVGQWYLKKLQEDPLRTKMLTSGSLAALQEFLASWIAKDRNKHGHYFTSRVPKMAIYGAFISAPLGHVMISILQKLFAGRTSLKAKIMQILVSNLVVCPRMCPSVNRRFADKDTIDRTNPERRLPHLHGRHRRRPHLPPSSRHRARRLHARYESLMDYLPACARIRPSFPPARDVGAVLQFRRVRYRDVHQRTYEEKAAPGVEEEVPGQQECG